MAAVQDRIFVGGGGEGYGAPQEMLLKYGNRHGLIAGATGTGKTVTLQVLAEGFSAAGVPVFLSDVKGDLSGLCQPGDPLGKTHEGFLKRAQTIGLDLNYRAFPVLFWDLFGQRGHPVRTTVAEMGPLLLSRLLELSEPQEGVLNVAFRLADDEGLALLDMKDLRALLTWIAENADTVSARYGLVSTQSVGAIQRRLLVLENEGGAKLFGEPALDLADLMRVDEDGMGRISVLVADRLMHSPRLYATFLLWLLSELFEALPEVGDPEKPKLVFFFDEAHLLFDDAPKALISRVEQVARLIRSKGVGVYFVTQNPADVPDAILGQLGNRVQHALRAFTAKDQKDLAKAAETYRANPRFAIAEAIREVGTGEAVTSFLEPKGVPGMAERTLIRPPFSRLGPAEETARAQAFAASPVAGKYDHEIDRESAFEILRDRAAKAAAEAARAEEPAGESGEFSRGRRYGGERSAEPRARKPAPGSTTRSSRSDSVTEAFAKSFARQLGSKSGQAVVRGVLGTLFGKR
ncbi:helicase HerA-like domain-containing protein [Pseudogemmobacter humi]|uniref:AAA-like domain protein n=1 Tax=Pseudogemmobacter humi TaxID=2483812 RepID=A0A3P5XW67_9RHOB|nr:helicase HerA-like domain-containing protein [Pseudogemmobacter humi]VDC33367.1 AAA-like domain protein [Pseudogemmobacter humi]